MLVFRLSVSACGPFRSGFSVACSLIVLLLVFKARCFEGFVSHVEDPGGGVPDVKVKSLSPQGKNSYICDPSQLWIAMGGVWAFP